MQRLLSLLPWLVIVFLCVAAPVFAADDAHGSTDPMHIRYDTAVWSIVVFVLLLVILRKSAWGPILEGLQKREETIRSSLEEAKKTRAAMEKLKTDFQKELADAHQQIPQLMEDARKKGDELAAQKLAAAAAKIQGDQERFRHEMEIAKDAAIKELWSQAAQLATLISAKAIGRSLTEEDHRRLLDEGLQEIGRSANN
ncbi:MAG: ATP synthase F0 subunit B [Gemmataceae bacterium]|nr:ATP synthase F0 subunit B [Gemmataceae bacterium]